MPGINALQHLHQTNYATLPIHSDSRRQPLLSSATMLSPNDISPKGKAASIRSFDSGYGSNTLEDEEPLRVCCDTPTIVVCRAAADLPQLLSQSGLSTEEAPAQLAQHSIGLGISGLNLGSFWNVHVEDKLRLVRPEATIVPVTTKLHVFTTRETLTSALPPPRQADNAATCITCQLWDLTNPGEGLKCDGCKSKDYLRLGVLDLFEADPRLKLTVPRLNVPQSSYAQDSSKRRNKTRCSACDLAHAIDPTKPSACSSCSPSPSFLSPNSPVQPSIVKRSCARRSNKLPPHALHHLRAWLRAHRDDPYPDADTKRVLAQECGITEKQVTTWFTNTRARKLALPIDPLYHSSEDDGADESDFSSATNTPVCKTSPTSNYGILPSNLCQPFPGSTPYDHTQLTLQTSRRGKKKDYRRANTVSPIDDSPASRTPATPSPKLDGHEQQTWQCTFCYQHLVPKSWRRHEETQHRPKYQWTCLATSPRLVISLRGESASICAFCQLKNPSEDHFLHSHRVTECSKKSQADRTFGRPDHLRQHIKNFHKTSLLDVVRDKWRRDGPGKNVNEGWTCGFCAAELKTWDIRETHISNHFKDGLTMADWLKGPESVDPVMINNRSRGEHTTMLSKLKTTFTGRPSHQLESQSLSHNTIPVTFDSLMVSSDCPNIVGAPVLPDFPDMTFGGYIPDTFLNDYDFQGVPHIGNMNNMYETHNNAYGVYLGDGSMQMSYESLADPAFCGNIIDYQGVWDTEQ
jgi:hypothetical protein